MVFFPVTYNWILVSTPETGAVKLWPSEYGALLPQLLSVLFKVVEGLFGVAIMMQLFAGCVPVHRAVGFELPVCGLGLPIAEIFSDE